MKQHPPSRSVNGNETRDGLFYKCDFENFFFLFFFRTTTTLKRFWIVVKIFVWSVSLGLVVINTIMNMHEFIRYLFCLLVFQCKPHSTKTDWNNIFSLQNLTKSIRKILAKDLFSSLVFILSFFLFFLFSFFFSFFDKWKGARKKNAWHFIRDNSTPRCYIIIASALFSAFRHIFLSISSLFLLSLCRV